MKALCMFLVMGFALSAPCSQVFAGDEEGEAEWSPSYNTDSMGNHTGEQDHVSQVAEDQAEADKIAEENIRKEKLAKILREEIPYNPEIRGEMRYDMTRMRKASPELERLIKAIDENEVNRQQYFKDAEDAKKIYGEELRALGLEK